MVTLNINGKVENVDVPADMPLLWALRDVVGLTGTKFGCGMALCGACTVHVDGTPIRSCVTPVSSVGRARRSRPSRASARRPSGRECRRRGGAERAPVRLLPERADHAARPALLATNPKPTDEDIDTSMAGNICRCGTYQRIRAAIKAAAKGSA